MMISRVESSKPNSPLLHPQLHITVYLHIDVFLWTGGIRRRAGFTLLAAASAAAIAGAGAAIVVAVIEPQNHHQHQDFLAVEGKERVSAISTVSAVSTHLT